MTQSDRSMISGAEAGGSTGADFEGLVVVTGRLLLETGPELVLLAVLLPDSACCIPNQIKPAIPPPP
ncbi:hypothetical protein OFM36_34510, partial [Escherichia coli]|nr:hypothetical protein [Escherichia coli]